MIGHTLLVDSLLLHYTPSEWLESPVVAQDLSPLLEWSPPWMGVSLLFACILYNIEITCSIFTAPGPVLNLMVGPKFTAVQISWDAPQMPNGDITQYEVTYRINGGSLMTNTTELATTFIIIPSLNPGTMVSNISVTAFTSGGRGVVSTAPDFTTPENPELRKCCIIDIWSHFNHMPPPPPSLSCCDQCPSGAAH